MDWNWFLFSFKGRINRARYWLAGLAVLCWMIFLAMIVLAVVAIFGKATTASFGFNVNDIFRMADPAAYRSAIDGFRKGELASATTLISTLFCAIGTLTFL